MGLDLGRSAADPIEGRHDRGEGRRPGPSCVVTQPESQRRRPAASLHLQGRHSPAIRGRRARVAVANDGGQGVQDVRLLGRGPNHDRGRDALGQLEIDVRARVADHHFAQQPAQPIAPAGL